MKTISVKFPPTNNPQSLTDAENLRNHRVDKLLSDALTSGRITQLDIDEYNTLYHRLVESEIATERAEILTRLSSIDGSTSASTNASTHGDAGDGSVSASASASAHGDAGDGASLESTDGVITADGGDGETVITTDLDITAPLKYFKP